MTRGATAVSGSRWRRAVTTTLAVLTATLAVTIGPAATPSTAAPEPTSVTTREVKVRVPVRDGVELLATVVTPTPAAPSTGWPVVIVPGTFDRTGENTNAVVRAQAARGYVAVSYIPRGLGESGGVIDAAGRQDVADVSDMLTWTLANTPADPNRAGVAGVSFGAGFLPMVIARDRRFKAGAMVSGWGDMWASLFPNGTTAISAVTALGTLGLTAGRLGPEGRKFFDDAAAGKQTSTMRAYAALRSPMTYLPQLRRHNVPMYMSTSMNEMIWPADQTIRFYSAYPGVKHLDIMPGDHATTEVFMNVGQTGYTWNGAFEWMDRYVAGRPAPISSQGPIRLAPRSSSGQVPFTTDWLKKYRVEVQPRLKVNTSTLRLQLNSGTGLFGLPERTLGATRGTGTTTLHEGTNLVMSNGLPMYQGINEVLSGRPTVIPVAAVDPKVTGIWTGQSLARSTSIRGPIRVHLKLRPTRATGTVVAYLLDQDQFGITYMIGHKPYSWSGATPGRTLPVDVTVPYQGYDLPAGHKLMVAVSTADVNYLDRNPAGSSVQVRPGSYVDLPVARR